MTTVLSGTGCIGTDTTMVANPPDRVYSFPTATIANNQIKLVAYLPDDKQGYYRSSRFDWSSMIACVRYRNHDWFFNDWIGPHDPLKPNHSNSVATEFGLGFNGMPVALGYDEAKPGETFLKIGVGELRKPETPEYKKFTAHRYVFHYPYEIVRTFPWNIKQGSDWIEYVQESANVNGYCYRFTRRISLLKSGDGFVLEMHLENLGSKIINQTVYEHNFVNIDDKPIEPGWRVHFEFTPKIFVTDKLGDFASLSGSDFSIVRTLTEQEMPGYGFDGFSQNATDNTFTVSAPGEEVKLRISSQEPLNQCRIFCTRYALCPEAFISIVVAPGQSKRWQTRYEFTP